MNIEEQEEAMQITQAIAGFTGGQQGPQPGADNNKKDDDIEDVTFEEVK